MKTFKMIVLSLSFALGLIITVVAQSADNPTDEPAAPATPAAAAGNTNATTAPPDQAVPPPNDQPTPQREVPAQGAAAADQAAPDNVVPPPAEAIQAQEPAATGQEPADSFQKLASPPKDQTPATGAKPDDTTASGETTPAPTEPVRPVKDGEKGLRLNFRNAPLEQVLNYFSEAAGFVIMPGSANVQGKVNVWANQPLTKDEAVKVLQTVLYENGYAAIVDGRNLKIASLADAKKKDIQVIINRDPKLIPKTDTMVTQIIPVRFVNAVQLSRDLTPLMPTDATVVANEGANSIVITDTQVNIRRMAEIINALDTAISSVSAVRVFKLQYADAKALATVIRDLFSGQDSGRTGGGGNNPFQQIFQGGRGGGRGGQGGMGGMAGLLGGMGGGGNSGGTGRVSTPRVVSVADEYSNSLIVSAPEEQMELIDDLVKKMDTSVEDVTELRVYHLKFADPQETADLLANLFPDTTSSQNTRGGQVRFGGAFGGGFGGGRGGGAAATADASYRMQKQTRVIAVPDLRTGSVIVSAARDLLDQISKMIEQLDSDPAKKQKVFVYSVENTDPAAVAQILQGLFEGPNSRNSSLNSRNSTTQAGNQLQNRATSRNQNTSSGFGGTGSSGFGGSGGTSSRTGR